MILLLHIVLKNKILNKSMSSIVNLIKNNSFTSFEEVKTFFKNAPYFFDVKETPKLYMLCFTDRSDISTQVAREATGIIFRKETNELVHCSFAKAYEAFSETEVNPTTDNDLFYIGNVKETDSLVIDYYFEGSVIKFYQTGNDIWSLATSKHLSANQNRWSSKKTFEQLFKECIPNSYNCTYQEFIKTLDPEYCYTFLFQHPDHSMALPVATPVCFQLNKVNLKTLEESNEERGSLTTAFTKISEINLAKTKVSENFLVYHLNSEGKILNRIKMLSNKFSDLKQKLGNYPNIGLSYIEGIRNPETVEFLRKTYPRCCEDFDNIDKCFIQTCKDILNIYIRKHISKMHANSFVTKMHSKIVYDLHGKYISTKKPVDIHDVIELITNLQPRQLAAAINYIY